MSVGGDVMAGAGGLLVQVGGAIAVKLHVEGEDVLLLEPVKVHLPGRDEHLLPGNQI